MHLWQIRHIPKRPQNLLKLTVLTAACLFAAVSLWPSITFVSGQTSETGPEKSDSDSKSIRATEFLERVRQELPNHRSIKAELTQSVSIGDQQFKVVGQYLSEGQKLMLSYAIVPDQGIRAEMLEVCDGKELWTMLTLPDSKRVTHRNVQQILNAAVAANKQNVSESTLNVELGLGGITALLASLERTMVFDAIKEENDDGHSRTIIQGRWKKEFTQRFPKDKEGALPAFIPDLIRLYVNSQTLFPEKLLYLKKLPQKKSFKSLVSLEFRHVEFDGPVDERAFVFPNLGDVVPEDVTKQYLDRLAVPAGDTPAAK